MRKYKINLQISFEIVPAINNEIITQESMEEFAITDLRTILKDQGGFENLEISKLRPK